jgi:cellulose/xylan binding protein with CBM9 domain
MILLFCAQLMLSCFCAGTNPIAKDSVAEDNIALITRCEDFEVTGEGLDASWSQTSWIEIPQRTEKPDTYTTKVKALYSETGIYFLFDCQDLTLTATMKADYLDLWNEDVVEVFLWTGEDFPVYFEYEISPLNYELPIIVPNDKGHFFGWLPWHYEGSRKTRHATSSSDEGWKAEFFIPYALLSPLPQVPPVPGTKWRANMYRIDYDQGQTTFSWQPTSGTFHEYQKFGTFIFQ